MGLDPGARALSPPSRPAPHPDPHRGVRRVGGLAPGRDRRRASLVVVARPRDDGARGIRPDMGAVTVRQTGRATEVIEDYVAVMAGFHPRGSAADAARDRRGRSARCAPDDRGTDPVAVRGGRRTIAAARRRGDASRHSRVRASGTARGRTHEQPRGARAIQPSRSPLPGRGHPARRSTSRSVAVRPVRSGRRTRQLSFVRVSAGARSRLTRRGRTTARATRLDPPTVPRDRLRRGRRRGTPSSRSCPCSSSSPSSSESARPRPADRRPHGPRQSTGGVGRDRPG